MDRIVAGAAVDCVQILAVAPVDEIVAIAAVHLICLIAGRERIVAAHSIDFAKMTIAGRAAFGLDDVVVIAALDPIDIFDALDGAAADRLGRERSVEGDTGRRGEEGDRKIVAGRAVRSPVDVVAIARPNPVVAGTAIQRVDLGADIDRGNHLAEVVIVSQQGRDGRGSGD